MNVEHTSTVTHFFRSPKSKGWFAIAFLTSADVDEIRNGLAAADNFSSQLDDNRCRKLIEQLDQYINKQQNQKPSRKDKPRKQLSGKRKQARRSRSLRIKD